MPKADVIHNSDLSHCGCGGRPVVPTPPPMPPHGYWCPPPPIPMDYPKYPCKCECEPEEPEVPIKKKSREEQICILSKKAAAINAMIEAFKDKNQDAIIKIGKVASYNFGPYYKDKEAEEVTDYGTFIMEILEQERALIKAKIAELAAELDAEEPETTTFSTLTTVTLG